MATSNRNVLLIANPAAQRGHGAEAARIAHDLLREWVGDEAVTLAMTDFAGHAVELAAEASSERYDTVIALGGDGIVHEVVNGLMRLPFDKRPSFGLVPVGSGNDYARTLGMSESVPDAVVQFLDARSWSTLVAAMASTMRKRCHSAWMPPSHSTRLCGVSALASKARFST